jgi:hypothetical protein
MTGTVSCGCFHAELTWKGYGDISGTYFNTVKKGAEIRNLEFNITIEFMWGLFLEQDRKCALTKDIIFFAEKRAELKNQTASLDRIDSSKGYFEDNVQWVHKYINMVKGTMTESEFFELCKLVVEQAYIHH